MINVKNIINAELSCWHVVVLLVWISLRMVSPAQAQNGINQSGEGYKDSVALSLQKGSILLNDVLIEADRAKYQEMILSAFEKIPENYPDKIHQLQGLYRNLYTVIGHYAYVEEAIVSIQDYGYRNEADSKIQILGYRENELYGKRDLRVVDHGQDYQKGFRPTLNEFYKHYSINYLRNFSSEQSHFNLVALKETINGYRFKLINATVSDSDTIFYIALGWAPNSTEYGDLSENTYIKINSSDLAIVEIQFSRGYPEWIENQVNIKYRKVNGKYYPYYIRDKEKRMFLGKSEMVAYSIRTYWFEDIVDSKIRKLKNRNILPSHKFSFEKERYMKDDTWFKNSYAQLHPLIEDLESDLDFDIVSNN